MNNALFVTALALPLAWLLLWSSARLPQEQWQMLAAVPRSKQSDGGWQGLNLTYYGFFTANAYVLAVGLCLVLLGALGAEAWQVGLLALGVLGICVPASRLVARVIEKKRHTFTTAGAFFTGVVCAPLILVVENRLLAWWNVPPLPTLPTLAAAVIAYVLGEGVGRLACMSFGCCYGRPLDDCPAWFQKLCSGRAFVFSGPTKKACYEGNLAGRRLAPIQALTASVLVIATLACVLLFLAGWFRSALLLGIVGPQLWRWGSEFLRADDRGGGRVSAYQLMALATIPYCALLTLLLPAAESGPADIVAGLRSLWDPAVILSLEALWVVLFLFTGRSAVTASNVSFHVCRERI